MLDTSGSMAGPKMEQAKKALLFCLANLSADDRFEIIRFSTEAEPLFGSLVPADRPHITRATSFIGKPAAHRRNGHRDALDRALALRAPGRARRGRTW